MLKSDLTTCGVGALALALVLSGCAQSAEKGPTETGEISFYADSLAGNKTASGEPYDPAAATCAHRKLPFGTELRIELVDGGATTTCTVNDRGPYAKDRILDVSRAVAEKLGFVKKGAVRARLTVLARPAKKQK